VHLLSKNRLPGSGTVEAPTPVRGQISDGHLIRCTTNHILHLILLPTEACNFRCIYCYEDFRFSRMEPWVVRGIKALVSRRAEGLYDLWISWFGGEPLLAKGVIDDVMTHAMDQASKNSDLMLRSDMTTNAYLLSKETFLRLYALKVRRFQITLDGPEHLHDQKRVLAGGRGTFQRIWENLLGIRDTRGDFSIMLRIHVAEDNLEAMPEFVERCAETFGGDPRFEFLIRALSRYGGPNDPNLPILGPEHRDAVLTRLRQLAKDRGARLAGYPKTNYVCYAAHGNSLVVRSNGRLNKCTVALENPENQVGTIREDGRVLVDSAKLAPWMRGLMSGDATELACPMKNHVRSGAAPVTLEIPVAKR
jgi:uncharacterized protein